MNRTKRQKLTKFGYRVTTAKDFLGLAGEEMALIELKLALVERVKELRGKKRMTPKALTRLMHSNQ